MVDTISPLQAIHQKELVLRQQVEQAHCRAEAQLEAARAEAQDIIAQAHQQGKVEADTIFQQGIQEARQQAEAIIVAAYDKAAMLRTQAEPRLDEVAESIVTFVLASEKES
jgi:vacuolar-type H+-ATPase subunit H